MNKSLRLSISLALAVGCSPLVFAATGTQATTPTTSGATQQTRLHGMHHHRARHHGMSILDQLDLSDTQRARIRQMMRQSFEQSRPEMQALRQKREAYDSATPGSPGYQAAASALATAAAKTAHERVTREAALRTKIYGVLSPAQRTKLASLLAKRKLRMKKWRTAHMQHSAATPASSGTR